VNVCIDNIKELAQKYFLKIVKFIVLVPRRITVSLEPAVIGVEPKTREASLFKSPLE
jgi:hypothetical protein